MVSDDTVEDGAHFTLDLKTAGQRSSCVLPMVIFYIFYAVHYLGANFIVMREVIVLEIYPNWFSISPANAF